MKRPADAEHPLPAQRAFLVRVHADAEVATGHLTGRVEHVASGLATHFASSEELLAFMERVLTTQRSARGQSEDPASETS